MIAPSPLRTDFLAAFLDASKERTNVPAPSAKARSPSAASTS